MKNIFKKKFTYIILCILIMVFIVSMYPEIARTSSGSGVNLTIKNETGGVFYENNINDTVFHISLTSNDSWYSYNSTNGGFHGGYDIGNFSDNITQSFTLENRGSMRVDVLISAEDFEDENGNFINVSKTDGDFQIYIPGLGWKNIPDNNEHDADGSKDNEELCIANSFGVGMQINDYDFRIRTGNTNTGNYSSHITVTLYSSKVNPCESNGEYVIP